MKLVMEVTKNTHSFLLPTPLSSHSSGCKVVASAPGRAAIFQADRREQPGGRSSAYDVRKAKLSQGPLASFCTLVLVCPGQHDQPRGHKALRMEILLLTRLISTTDKVGDLLGKKSW